MVSFMWNLAMQVYKISPSIGTFLSLHEPHGVPLIKVGASQLGDGANVLAVQA